MTILAHLSDLHLLEPRYGERRFGPRARLSYLSLLRPLDPRDRVRRARHALAEAKRWGFDHLVVTGDVTEDGVDAQFEVLAEVLSESGIPRERVTIVPGNHDAYDDGAAFERALRGPLSPYAATSAPCSVVDLRDVCILPVSTAMHQTPLSSAGSIAKAELEALDRRVRDPALRRRAVIVAQHHQPGVSAFPPAQWLDGFREHAPLAALFAAHEGLSVVHGHTHRAVDKRVHGSMHARVFSALAVVESGAPLRRYEVNDGRLSPMPSHAAAATAVPSLSTAV